MTSSPGRDQGAAPGRDEGAAPGPTDLAYWRPAERPTRSALRAGGPRWRRLLVLLLCAVLGVVVCGAGLVVHRHVDAHVPWGVVLSVLAAFTATRAAGYLGDTTGAVVFAVPYAVVLLLTMSSRPEGDYLISADVRGYAFLLGSLLALGAGVVLTVREPGHTRDDAVEGPRTLDP